MNIRVAVSPLARHLELLVRKGELLPSITRDSLHIDVESDGFAEPVVGARDSVVDEVVGELAHGLGVGDGEGS